MPEKTRVSDFRDNKIRVASSVIGMNSKIVTDIDEGADMIFWRIRFNMELDKATVSKKNMNVTDTDGYLLKTDIKYDDRHIMLLPIESYESNQYYLLNISKKVRSINGSKLKREIHILFKLVDNKMASYKILPSHEKVAKPRPRPKDYEKTHMNPEFIVKYKPPVSKLYSFDKESVEASKDKMIQQPIKINMLIGLLGLVTSAVCVFLQIKIGVIICMLILLLGVGHIIFQMTRRPWRAVLAFNKGVRYFNKERYVLANVFFQKAQWLDPQNEIAEYAVSKISFYL